MPVKIPDDMDLSNPDNWAAGGPGAGTDLGSAHGPQAEQDSDFVKSLRLGAGATVGGSLGGLVGTIAGGPVGGFAGGVAGGGAGATMVDQMGGGDLQSAREAYLTGALGEAGGRLLGPVVAKGVGKALSPEVRAFLERIPGGSRLFRPYNANIEAGAAVAQQAVSEYGGTLSMGQVTDDSLIDTLEHIARTSWFSRSMMRKQQEKAIGAATQGIEEYVDGIVGSMGPMERGKLLTDTINGADTAFHGAANKMAGEVDALYGGAPAVDLSNALDNAVAKRAELLRTLGGQANTAVGRLEDFVAPGNPEKPIPGLAGSEKGVPSRIPRPTHVTFAEAQKLRSSLLRLKDVEGDAAAPDTRRVTSQLIQDIDSAMQAAGERLPGTTEGGSAADAWRQFNAFYKAGSKDFNSQFLVKWLNTETPSQIYDAVMKAAPEEITSAMRAIESLPANLSKAHADPRVVAQASEEAANAVANMQGGVMANLLYEAGSEAAPGVRVLSGGRLNSAVYRLLDVQDARLKALFPKGQQEEFLRRVHALSRAASDPEKGGIGTLAIQSRSASAGITIMGAALGALGGHALGAGPMGQLGGVSLGGAMAIVLTPRAIATLFSDKAAVDALISGMRAPVGTKTAARAMAHFVSQMARLKLLDDPGTKIPLPVPSAGEPPRVEGIETGEDVLRRHMYDKNVASRDARIMRLWEAAAAGAPEQ